MGRPYYSRIARAWHEATGSSGGPLKRYVLNDLLLDRVGAIEGRSILEVGAGTGYFARLLTQRYSGQHPERLVVSDQSRALLDIARKAFPVKSADYRILDLRRPFPFETGTFDIVVASMVLNELSAAGLSRALSEIRRVLNSDGRVLATVVHPSFVARLKDEGKLSRLGPSFWTMPGKGSLRLPVVPRSLSSYLKAFSRAGFAVEIQEVSATERMIRERPGLRHTSGLPLALVLEARCGEEVA